MNRRERSRQEDDWIHSEMPDVFARLGAASLPALQPLLGDPHAGVYSRMTAASSLGRVVDDCPSLREEISGLLASEMERFEANDPELNGALIMELVALGGVEARPLIERAFAAERVDTSLCGSLRSVRAELDRT